MFKRIMLMLTFIAAFGTVGVGLTNSANAWRGGGWGRPYGAYYYGPPRAYYGGFVPYRAYYAPRVFAQPVYVAYPPYDYYAYPGSYYYVAPRPAVSVSFGF